MAQSIIAYDHLWSLLLTGRIDLDSDTLKIALVLSSYTPSVAHTQWSDVSASEVTAGSGYSAGGIALTTPVVTSSTIGYADPVWTSLTKTFRYGVCYKQGTVGGLINPLLFYILFDTTPNDVIQTGSNFSINFNSVNKLFYRP